LRSSNEARILLDMLKQIRSQLPADPRDILRKRVAEAVKAEKYEEAASLRDQLGALVKAMANPASKATREPDQAAGPGGWPPAMPKPAVKRESKKRSGKEAGD